MRPVKYSLLAARTVTRQGGEKTQFADMRGAYDALPTTSRNAIERTVVEHKPAAFRAG